MSTAISISGLVKTFGTTVALDGLDLEVTTGEVHGFLGPNGSGKTTTIRILLGLLRADRGKVVLLGGDPWQEASTLHRRLAYVPGEVALWPNLTGGEVIDLLARLRGGIDQQRRARLLELFDLETSLVAPSIDINGNPQPRSSVYDLLAGQQAIVKDKSDQWWVFNKKKKLVVIASTSEVYGKSEDVPFREDSDLVMGPTPKHRWAYACSKAIDEFLALAYWKERKLPVIIVRFFNTVGPRQSGQYGMVIPNFVRQALAGEPITVFGDGTQQRAFTHVTDVVGALLKLIASKRQQLK